MTHDDPGALVLEQLRDAALVHTVRRRIQRAVSALAADPLGTHSASAMRCALQHSPAARAALQRLTVLVEEPEVPEPFEVT